MDDAKVKELRLLHRELASYLKNQHKITNNCILAVAAIRGGLASDSALQKAYKASLAQVKAGSFLVDQGYENTHQTLLKKLKEW